MKPELVYWNIECALGSMYRLMTHCKWVNPLEEFNQHRHKGFQLHQFSQLGVRIPKTIITNSAEDIQAFFHEENANVILKYPHGGKHTVKLNEEDVYQAGFAEHLTKIPVKIQECIHGMDIRAYVIGNEVFALEIHSDKLDFRETPNTFRKAIELPDSIRNQCLLIRKTLGLHMAGIDIKRTETGEHVFLEANPSPVFLYDEVATGYPISQTIANLLMA
jgi:glutathione synthase/RimK-type ligase-like ATP-grasp enzyme